MPLIMLKTISLWLWNNRKLVAVLIVAGSIFFFGHHVGAAGVERRWAAAEQARLDAVEADRLKRQAEADAKEAALVKKNAELQNTVNSLFRSLSHETRDPAYRCKPTVDGLQQLNDIRAAARRAAGE